MVVVGLEYLGDYVVGVGYVDGCVDVGVFEQVCEIGVLGGEFDFV